MAHEEQLDGAAATARPKGVSRRTLIATGSTLAVAGVAVGVAIPFGTTNQGDQASAPAGEGSGPVADEPVMLHLQDARSGRFALFVGTRHTSFTDREMAAQLGRAAASAS